MIKVYNNPFLTDFIDVSFRMPEDERRQLEAFTGHEFDVDGCAVGNYTAPGLKWVFKYGDRPIIVGGFVPQRPGVWRDFLLTTPEAWEPQNWFQVTRICRRIMDAMFISGQAHRLECITHGSREKAMNWFRVLGYEQEALLSNYCANGDDAFAFSRVRK
jgi:hypothetical protein